MANVAYEDLSGTSTPITSNPFDGFLQACNNDPQLIQSRYSTHRTSRNNQQKQKILSSAFPGWNLDPNLVKLTGPKADPAFTDPRFCLTFWARPPLKVRNLVDTIQQKLRTAAPGLWLMPLPNLHATAMEVAHSKTESECEFLTTSLLPTCQTIADLTSTPGHAARLIKPMLSFDDAAFALTFVPAAGEGLAPSRTSKYDAFTYHHLRRKLHSLIGNAVPVASRYVVPSAHLTIARFNTPNPFVAEDASDADQLDHAAGTDMAKREHLIAKIDEINHWLQEEYWPRSQTGEDGAARETILEGGEWIVGEEKGLDFRTGRLWYGGGETIYLGKAT